MLKSLIKDQGISFETVDVLEETRINVIVTRTSLSRREDVDQIMGQIVIENVDLKSASPVKTSTQKKLDVVCGMQVEPGLTSFNVSFNGEDFWFCSLMCKEQFVKNPKQYERNS